MEPIATKFQRWLFKDLNWKQQPDWFTNDELRSPYPGFTGQTGWRSKAVLSILHGNRANSHHLPTCTTNWGQRPPILLTGEGPRHLLIRCIWEGIVPELKRSGLNAFNNGVSWFNKKQKPIMMCPSFLFSARVGRIRALSFKAGIVCLCDCDVKGKLQCEYYIGLSIMLSRGDDIFISV